jgi:hypothetical protein
MKGIIRKKCAQFYFRFPNFEIALSNEFWVSKGKSK